MVNAFYMNSQFAFSRMPHYFRLKSLSKSLIKPKIQIDFENEFYQVKTINTPNELSEVMKLRFDVFFKEFSKLPSMFSFFCYDIDMHDFLCDHIIVKDKQLNKIIACYRVMLSGSNSQFYSESEFILTDFLSTPDKKLELGRACVHKDFRSSSVITLLWKGLMEYAKRSGVRYLFGCSSVPKKDLPFHKAIMQDLERRDAFITDFNIGVQPEFLPEAVIQKLLDDSESSKTKAMSSLMNMYLLAGAKFSKSSAYDSEMECLDLMTILDLSKLPASFERKFG